MIFVNTKKTADILIKLFEKIS
jgi:superfamily II DNA/RNA helicase